MFIFARMSIDSHANTWPDRTGRRLHRNTYIYIYIYIYIERERERERERRTNALVACLTGCSFLLPCQTTGCFRLGHSFLRRSIRALAASAKEMSAPYALFSDCLQKVRE